MWQVALNTVRALQSEADAAVYEDAVRVTKVEGMLVIRAELLEFL